MLGQGRVPSLEVSTAFPVGVAQAPLASLHPRSSLFQDSIHLYTHIFFFFFFGDTAVLSWLTSDPDLGIFLDQPGKCYRTLGAGPGYFSLLHLVLLLLSLLFFAYSCAS